MAHATLVVLASLAITVPVYAAPDELEQSYSAVKRSLALVVTFHNGRVVSTGSAFCIGSTHSHSYFVTNKHVVAGGETFALVRQYPRFKEAVGRLVRTGTTDDLALLDIAVGDIPALPLASGLPAEGHRIAVAGYPRTQITMALAGLGLTASLHAGTVNALPAGGYFIQYDAQTEPGNSGGPLFDARNASVYGIVTLKFRTSNESNIAISASRISAFLSGSRIAFSRSRISSRGVPLAPVDALLVTPEPTPTPTPTPEPTPMVATEQCQAGLDELRAALADLAGSYERYTNAYATTTAATAAATTRMAMIGAQVRVNLEIRAIRSTIDAEEPKLLDPQRVIEQSGALSTARRTNSIIDLIHQRDQYALSMSRQRKSLIDNIAAGGGGFAVNATPLNEANRLTNQITSALSDLRFSPTCKS